MSDASVVRSISLFFTDGGSSDKVYQAQIKARDGGFVVEFQYGKRGAALQSGCKTPAPVALEAAEKVFAKLAGEKKAKGYTESESGVGYQDTDKQGRVSGVLPQLLNPIDEDTAIALTLDSAWVAQEKHDGNRTLIKVHGGEVTGINRKGLTIPLPQAVVDAARAVRGQNDFILDGELVGEVLHVFDILRHDGADTTAKPLSVRLILLDNYPTDGAVRCTPTYRSTPDKQQAVASLRANGAEGCVFKFVGAPYKAGRPNAMGNALKLKFVATASVRIGQASSGKRSVAMQVLDANGDWADVGNVTIPPNHAIPGVGAIAEVRYLYAHRGGALFQPVYLGQRNDIDADDCTIAQLQFKGEGAQRAAA